MFRTLPPSLACTPLSRPPLPPPQPLSSPSTVTDASARLKILFFLMFHSSFFICAAHGAAVLMLL
jgi:hypothetical protein